MDKYNAKSPRISWFVYPEITFHFPNITRAVKYTNNAKIGSHKTQVKGSEMQRRQNYFEVTTDLTLHFAITLTVEGTDPSILRKSYRKSLSILAQVTETLIFEAVCADIEDVAHWCWHISLKNKM